LSIEELDNLRFQIEEKFSQNKVVQNFQNEESLRVLEGVQCPHCKSKHASRNGKHKGRQRYICVDCQKTFWLSTHSIFAWSKKSVSVWMHYGECMVNGFSLRKCAEECGIIDPRVNNISKKPAYPFDFNGNSEFQYSVKT
jgi:transposase-like protein